MSSKTKYALFGILAGILLVIGMWATHRSPTSELAEPAQGALQSFSVSDLTQFDGSDPNKPIYLALNGFVYDVSNGRTYYEPGGTYHWLAGKDSSSDLNLIGGEIIKQKYPVVGTLIQ